MARAAPGRGDRHRRRRGDRAGLPDPAAAHHPRAPRRDRRRRVPPAGQLQGLPDRAAVAGMRRPRAAPQGPPGPRRRLPPAQADRGLRLRRQPRRSRRAHPHPRQVRVGRRRAACLPDRRLRHRQVPPADRPGHRRRRERLPGEIHHRRRAGQRAGRGRRRQDPVAHHRPLRPGRPAVPGRAGLPRARPPRRRAAVPGLHRARGTRLHRDRLQRRLLRVDLHLHRPPAVRRDRRPAHLRGPHHPDRQRLLPAARHQDPPQATAEPESPAPRRRCRP